MAHLALEAKKLIVARALSRSDISLQQIAEESNVGYSTLQRWLSQIRKGLPLNSRRCDSPLKGHGQTPPLQHLLATARLDEQAVGVYCREQGIHSFQLKQWQNELMKHSDNKNTSAKESAELKELRNEVKRLKKDLNRKDKALAETSALLVLKKKADLIWGDLGDD
jgi:transposase-like protein